MAIFPFEQAIKNIFLLAASDFPAKSEQSQTDHVLSSVLVGTVLTVADWNFISLSWSQLLLSNLGFFWLNLKLLVSGSCSRDQWMFLFVTLGVVCQVFFAFKRMTFSRVTHFGERKTLLKKQRMWHLEIAILVKRNFCMTWKFYYHPYRKMCIFASQ